MDAFDYGILNQTAHRPWPMPTSPWVMTQTWHDLLFAHWPVDGVRLRALVPAEFPLDLYDGQAWLGIVPFRMANVGPRGVPSLPGVSAFPELNVRTYVRVADRPGVYFFSLDAASALEPLSTSRREMVGFLIVGFSSIPSSSPRKSKRHPLSTRQRSGGR